MTTDGVSTTVSGAVPGMEIKQGGLGPEPRRWPWPRCASSSS